MGQSVALHGEELGASVEGVTPYLIPAQRREPPSVRGSLAAASRDVAQEHRGYAVELAVVLALDALVVAGALAVTQSVFTAVTAAVAATAWKARGLYDTRIGLSLLDDLPALSGGTAMGLGLALIMTGAWVPVHATTVLVTGLLLLCGVTAGRSLAYATIRRQRATGHIVHRTLVVGAGATASALVERIVAHPESGLRLVGTVADRSGRTAGPLPVLGAPKELATVVRDHRVSDVIIGYGGSSTAELIDVLRAAGPVDAGLYVVPRLFELETRRGDDNIWGLPLVRVRGPANRMVTWRLKRTFDVVMASLALVVAAPVFVAVALAVRLELGPGVFFKQVRVGAGGKTFLLLKFRSLLLTATGDTPPWAVPAEALGRVGRFIRRYSLDELPQLLNVLRGEMSLVGPRPERPEFVEQFSTTLPWYRHRHRVPAGLTGLAAVNGLRGDTSIEDRARFDNWYIDNWSLWLDSKILVRTVWSVLHGSGS
jgi:exopolysaccharide biosynthesis polyprenyl glycosylphosphotransferase